MNFGGSIDRCDCGSLISREPGAHHCSCGRVYGYDERDDALGAIQLFDGAVLAAVARGELDLNAIARKELANRGLNERGEWVGF